MDSCNYSPVNKTVPTEVQSDEESPDSNNKMSRKFLIRQIFISSGIWTSFFAYGLSFGSPTVIIPQLRREANSTEAVSMEMASSLSSTYTYSAAVSSVILVIFAKLIGRKLTFLLVVVTALIGYVLFYCSTSTTHLLISEVIHGPLAGSTITTSIMILTEYTTPRYRGVLLTLKSATFMWGVWVANAIGTYFHWKNIGILGFACMMYSLLTVYFWPESPYWLAAKNRFEECSESSRWLKGYGKDSENELKALIESRHNAIPKERNSQNQLSKILKMFSSKIFYKPAFFSLIVSCIYNFSGKLACGMYALDIIKRITKTESSAYNGMLILDGITLLGMYIGCGLSKICRRKCLFLATTTVATSFLFFLSVYLYLINLKIISEYPIVSFSLLLGYSLSISMGPIIMSTSILGELIPVKYRNSMTIINGFFHKLILGSFLKITPFIIHYTDISGLFLFFAIAETFFIIVGYKVLPETKDKSLLEIQEMFVR